VSLHHADHGSDGDDRIADDGQHRSSRTQSSVPSPPAVHCVNAQDGDYHCDVCNEDNCEVKVGGGRVVRSLDRAQLIGMADRTKSAAATTPAIPPRATVEDMITFFASGPGRSEPFLLSGRHWPNSLWF
jgi:hypothetical protein